VRGPGGLALALALLVAACGDSEEPRAADPLDADTFAGEAETVEGGTLDLGTLADRDLVVWFWAPW
jgi:hypothetical protein